MASYRSGLATVMTSGSRPAILALTQCLPFPPHTGVTNRIFHVLTGLQRHFDVFLVPFVRRFHHPSPAAESLAHAALGRCLTWSAGPVPVPAERWAARRVVNHFASLVTAQPYIRFEYSSGAFGKAMRDGLAMRAPALVHAESIDLYGWFDRLPAVPLAVTHHSIESDLLRIRSGATYYAVARGYLGLQARLLEVVERRWATRVSANLMMSTIDAERLQGVAPGCPTLIVPNGVDLDYFTREPGKRPQPGRLVFVGPTYVHQNRQAVDWFLAESWPLIRRVVPGATLDMLGGARPEDVARYGRVPGVTLHGHVPDIRPYLQSAAVSIAPIRVGGGTRLKILDAWAMETPVVSTSIGCEGLVTVTEENILIRDDPQAFADGVVSLLNDSTCARRMGRAGRATVEGSYGWDRITSRLAEHYSNLVA